MEAMRNQLHTVSPNGAEQTAQMPQVIDDEERLEQFASITAEDFANNLTQIEASDPDAVAMRGLIYASALQSKGTKLIKAHLLRGEDEAVEGFVRNPLKGDFANYILASPYGAGKTELFEYGMRIYGPLNTGYVPTTPDLKAGPVVGSYQAMLKINKAVVEGDKDEVTRLVGEHEAIITEDLQALLVDEATRGAPRTMGAMSNAIGSRKIELGGDRIVRLNKLLMSYFAVNPLEDARTANKLPGQIGARITGGTILGCEDNWETILNGMDDWEKRGDLIVPVTNAHKLYIARAALKYVEVNEEDQRHAVKASTIKMLYMQKNNSLVKMVPEAPGRPRRQIETNAQAIALTEKRLSVSREDIEKGAKEKMVATLVSNGAQDLAAVKTVVDEAMQGKFVPDSKKHLI